MTAPRSTCRNTKKALAEGGPSIHAAVHGGHGSLRQRAPLGAGDRPLWTRGPADAAGLWEALCEAQQERRPGRGGDLRGGGPANDALCAGEEHRAAGDAGRSRHAGPVGSATNDYSERAARGTKQAWDRGGTGI